MIIIVEILNKFLIADHHKREIIELYQRIKDKSSMINRSRPQSVASGVIWYWIMENKKQMNIKEFTVRVELSELTILKMKKEITRILSLL